jgi:hypothetical protein
METITYSLRGDQSRSDQYYQDVAVFTDEVIRASEDSLVPVVEAFRTYMQDTGLEKSRTYPEYVFELLTLAVLWQVYGENTLRLTSIPQKILLSLVHLRQRGGWVKSVADSVRGVLLTAFLMSKNGQSGGSPPPLTPENIDRLLNWLRTTGDFKEEVRRLAAWHRFFVEQPLESAFEALAQASRFADWFEVRSEAVLGHYTSNVERFLRDIHPSFRGREDVIFCGRQRVEYHMNMVGTEILNRAFRKPFLATRRKAVFVPPCMRHPADGQCQAKPTPFGARCAHCTPGCRVHQVTKLGEKHGFEVFMLPDDLVGLSSGTTTNLETGELGIIGISCPLTNVSGGWQTKRLGIPAQGVLLDYCGCSWHWHYGKGGIPTDINFRELLRTLGITDGTPRQKRPAYPEETAKCIAFVE